MAENKRSVLVTAAAWFLIAAGGFLTTRAAYGNFTLAVMFESPGAMVGLARSTMPVDAPPLARLAVENIRLVFLLYFFVSLAVCVTGFGLLLRKAWGLNAFKWLCYLGGASCLLIFLFPGLAVPKPFTVGGVQLTPEFNAAVRHLKFQLRLAAALFGAGVLWLGWRFERADIGGEFGLAATGRG